MMTTTYIIVGVVVLLLVVLITISYVKAPPSIAFIISGLGKEPRVLIGQGGFRIPGLERLDKVYLGQINCDVKTEEDVPTQDFINVAVDGCCKVRVILTTDGIRLAAKNFLNMSSQEIASQLKDTLQSNCREIVGTLGLRDLNQDRDAFGKKVAESASKDMEKLGIEILSFNIQSITDREGLIKDLGADNTARIKKDASINKARAEKDIQIEVARADQEANDARVAADIAIAEKQNTLLLKQAELKKQSDIAKADADAAYEIQKQEQQKLINTKTVEAEIEKTKQEKILSKEQIEIEQNRLEAEINKKADSEKYQKERNAEAKLEQEKRDAESKRYSAEQEAVAIKAHAEAELYKKQKEAEGIVAVGEAEAKKLEMEGKAKAEAIRAQGEAEAAAMDKKAEAYKKYNQVALAQMLVEKLPVVAESIGKSIAGIQGINIYSTGGQGTGIEAVSGAVPVMIKQAMDIVGNVTGVDMSSLIKADSIEAKTNRNINMVADADVTVDNVE
jgi:flotillin